MDTSSIHTALSIPDDLTLYVDTARPPSGRNAITLNDTRQNRLLAGLSDADLARLAPHLERVEMRRGEVIYQYGSQSKYVYFPTTAIVSLMYDMVNGASAQVAIVGNEGMIGVGLFMAGETMPGLAQVQCAGFGYRLSPRILNEEFNNSGSLQRGLLCYTQALIVEIAQTAVCNRHHTIRQQLCRCLLLTLDRSSGHEMALTHEMIADSMGVRRECVTMAALKLRAEGLIDYRRGHVTVLDRSGLESESCECYAVVKNSFDRLLPREAALYRAVNGAHYSCGSARPGRQALNGDRLQAMK